MEDINLILCPIHKLKAILHTQKGINEIYTTHLYIDMTIMKLIPGINENTNIIIPITSNNYVKKYITALCINEAGTLDRQNKKSFINCYQFEHFHHIGNLNPIYKCMDGITDRKIRYVTLYRIMKTLSKIFNIDKNKNTFQNSIVRILWNDDNMLYNNYSHGIVVSSDNFNKMDVGYIVVPCSYSNKKFEINEHQKYIFVSIESVIYKSGNYDGTLKINDYFGLVSQILKKHNKINNRDHKTIIEDLQFLFQTQNIFA